METPEIFCDKTYLASNQFILSTSQVLGTPTLFKLNTSSFYVVLYLELIVITGSTTDAHMTQPTGLLMFSLPTTQQ